MPNEHHPQPGAISSRLSAYAQAMIEARQRLEMAQTSTRRAANALDLAQDDFTDEYHTSGLDTDETLVFKSREGELWVIKVDIEDGSVISITPAVEIE